MRLELSARTDERPRCSYCREDVPPAELDECPTCRTTLHLACRAELGRCPTVGCAQGRVSRQQTWEQQVQQARAWVRALADDGGRPWPGVHRPRGPIGVALALASGALLGLVGGWSIGGMTSRPGHEALEMWRFLPEGTLLGALEAAAICALGIRKEPRLRLPWGLGERRDAIPLVLGLLVAAALGGGIVAAEEHRRVSAFFIGLVPLPLLVLPLALRWLGWSEGPRP